MKSKFTLFLFLIFSSINYSQSSGDNTIYLDSSLNATTKDAHSFYRVVKEYYSNKDSYQIYDYYKSGTLLMEGNSKTKDGNSRQGEFIFYYKNGNKKSVSNYVKGRPNGKEVRWYENGSQKLIGEYIEDPKKLVSQFKIEQFWNSNGVQTVIDGNGDYEEVGEKHFASGKVKDGFKDGFWEGYDKRVGYTFTETYENKKIILGVSIDSHKIVHNYEEVELKPRPQYGFNDFYSYIGKNFRTSILPTGTTGKVIVGFKVDKEGNLIEPKILRSHSNGIDEEALRLIANAEKWVPGEIRGIKVDCTFSLPISINNGK